MNEEVQALAEWLVTAPGQRADAKPSIFSAQYARGTL
jgi:hypothetical protein